MSREITRWQARLNKWKAVYIERCTYGLEGSIWKPAIEIQQGAGCLPYESDKDFFQKRIRGRGYVDTGTSIISEFYTPLVPKDHDFIETIKQIYDRKNEIIED